MKQNLIQVLAAAKPEEVADFIKVLYVAVIGLSSDQVDKKLASEMTAWLPKARRVESELGTNILDDILALAKGKDFEEDKLTAVAKALRISLRQNEIQKDPHIPHNYVDMLMAATAYIMGRSERKLAQLIRLASDLDEPALTQAFVVQPTDQKSFVKPLRQIVRSLTKTDAIVLTAEQIKELKAKSPTMHRRYLELRKEFNASWRTALRSYVYDSGKKALPFDKVVKYLDGMGLQHTLPAGFEGLIDGNGKIYTTAGKAIKTMPGPGFSVVMNPDYDPKKDDQYVFTTVNEEGERSQHVYTVSYSKAKTQEKFEKVHALMENMTAIQKKWMPHVRKGTKDPQCVASTMLEIMFQYSARIGSLGNQTKGKDTQGISTLLVKNVKVKGNQIVISYPGKDNVRQIHLIEGNSGIGKILANNLKMFTDGKEPTDFLFTYEWNGTEKRMTGNLVNKWFAKLGAPEGVTVHKLRHYRGSVMFEELLKENEDKIFNAKKPLTETQATKLLKLLATKVGQQLGHVRGVGKQQKVTPATAIQNYIDPGLMVGLYTRLGLRPPKFLAKFL